MKSTLIRRKLLLKLAIVFSLLIVGIQFNDRSHMRHQLSAVGMSPLASEKNSIFSVDFGTSIAFAADPDTIGDPPGGGDCPKPSAPQNVAASGSLGEHPTVSWSANPSSDSVIYYHVYRKISPDEQSFSCIATLNSNQLSYTDVACTIREGTGGQWATYYVIAENRCGPGPASSQVSKPVNYNPQKAALGPDQAVISSCRVSTYLLEQNYPNPFNPSTRLEYQIPEDAQVTLRVFDILGCEVATLVNQFQEAGYHATTFIGQNLSGGVYIVRFVAADDFGRVKYSQTRKLILAK